MLRSADASVAKPSPVLDAADVRAVLLAEIDRLTAVIGSGGRMSSSGSAPCFDCAQVSAFLRSAL
jgi:hypothetical protein